RTDAVLVPGDVPGHGHDQLTADAGKGHDARTRLAETLRDAADRPAVVARVEGVRGLDHLLLRDRQPAEDWLRHDGIVGRLQARVEQGGDPTTLPAPLIRDGRRGRTAFLDPPVVDRQVLAERADVEELLA